MQTTFLIIYGIYYFHSGNIYKGNWINSVPTGIGQLIFNDGSEYNGEFKNGKQHGYGQLLSVDGTIYKGNWIENVKSGYGELNYSSGDYYHGEWLNDLKHGLGKEMHSIQLHSENSDVQLEEGIQIEDITYCPDCDAELKVTKLTPPKVETVKTIFDEFEEKDKDTDTDTDNYPEYF